MLLDTVLCCHLLMVINLLAMYFLLSSIPYSTIPEICNSFCLFTFCCSHFETYSSLMFLKMVGHPSRTHNAMLEEACMSLWNRYTHAIFADNELIYNR